MPQQKKKTRWLPRFSLKAFLVASVFLGVTFGWSAKHYHEYQAEQNIIEDAVSQLTQTKNHSLTVYNTNGTQKHAAGNVFSWHPQQVRVVVNYQGPAMLHSLCDRFEIPIFDRIIGVTFNVEDFSNVPISKRQLASLQHLKTVSLQKWRSGREFDPSELGIPKDLVKPCQIASVTKDEDKRKVDIAIASLACCAK